MRERNERDRQIDQTLLLGLFILILFASPLVAWWSAADNLWYLPYLLWFGVILLIAWVNRRRKNES